MRFQTVVSTYGLGDDRPYSYLAASGLPPPDATSCLQGIAGIQVALWRKSLQVWFAQVEATFSLYQVTSKTFRFHNFATCLLRCLKKWQMSSMNLWATPRTSGKQTILDCTMASEKLLVD